MSRVLFTGIGSEIGGIESFAREVFKFLKSYNQFFFLTTVSPEQSAFFEEFSQEGAKYVFDDQLFGIKNALSREKKIEAIIRKFKIDIIHINASSLNAVYMVRAAKATNVKTIFYLHNSGTSSRSLLINILTKSLAPLNKRILMRRTIEGMNKNYAVSRRAGTLVFGNKMPFKVVLNGVDTSRFLFSDPVRFNTRGRLKIKRDDKVGVILARLVPIKNHKRAIDIFLSGKTLLDYLLIVGSGPENNELRRYAAKSGKRGRRVIFTGESINPAEYLFAADVMILASFSEGLGTSVIEGQAAGLPCVVSAGVPVDVNITKNVKFVDLSDSDRAWAEAINSTLELSVNRKGMNRVVENSPVSLVNFISQILSIYSFKSN